MSEIERAPGWAWLLLIVVALTIIITPSLLRETPPSTQPPTPPTTQPTQFPQLRPESKPNLPIWRWKAFEIVSLNRGDTVETKWWVAEGVIEVVANKEFLVLSTLEDGVVTYKAGKKRTLWGKKPEAPVRPLRLVGLHDNTVVELTRIR